jgi:hypothetical protein
VNVLMFVEYFLSMSDYNTSIINIFHNFMFLSVSCFSCSSVSRCSEPVTDNS